MLLVTAFLGVANAHELRPAYLELREKGDGIYSMLFKVPARGPDKRLALYVRLPPDSEIVIPTQTVFSDGAFVERSTIRRQGGLGGTKMHIQGLSNTLTDVLVRIEHADGATQVGRLTADVPTLLIESAPGKLEVARTYLLLGVEHILLGIDHLLFVLTLILIVRGGWLLVKTITAFTVAHSITLGAAVLGFVHVPQAPVEAAIALSIVFLAAELLRSASGDAGLAERYPWIVAFVFGCLHGFGFAGALTEVGLPLMDIPLALLMFNAGVEIGQLMFVAASLVLIKVVKSVGGLTTTWARTGMAYGIGGISAYWLIERVVGFW